MTTRKICVAAVTDFNIDENANTPFALLTPTIGGLPWNS